MFIICRFTRVAEKDSTAGRRYGLPEPPSSITDRSIILLHVHPDIDQRLLLSTHVLQEVRPCLTTSFSNAGS